MKKLFLFIGLSILSFNAIAQDITGDWYGSLDVGITKLRMVLHIQQSGDNYSATMDSPDQNAKDIPVPNITFKTDTLKIDLSNLGAKYVGVYDAESETIEGIFSQMGQNLEVDFSREKIAAAKRPQTPEPPFPYHSEDLTFRNEKEGINLAGTLTYPKKGKDFPAVILIVGSGPHDRNEEIFHHKPFLVIADYLTRHGIAVLRYDDRGVGQSSGQFSGATTADLATDVEAAFKYLKTRPEINASKIGLIGHSEGGMIAPIVAVKHSDVDFVVLLAGPAVKGADILLEQQLLIGKAEGMPEHVLKINSKINKKAFEMIENTKDSVELGKKLKEHVESSLKKYPEWNTEKERGVTDKAFVKMILGSYMDPWMRYFIAYDPQPVLEKLKTPILALDGTNDVQVSAKQNLPALKKALKKAGNKDVTIKKMKNLNHLFQESKSGSISEYAEIEQTFSPKALEIIKNWILKETK